MALQNSIDTPGVIRIRESGQYTLESKLLRCAFAYYFIRLLLTGRQLTAS